MKIILFFFISLFLLVGCGKHSISRPLNGQAEQFTSYSRDIQRKFLEAVINDDFSQVVSLIGEGAKIDFPDSLGKTPLIESVLAKNLLMSDLLLELGANPQHKDNSGKDSFQYSQESQEMTDVLNRFPFSQQYLDSSFILSAKEARPDERGSFHRTIIKLKRLLDKGAQVNAQDQQKNSALIYSAYYKLHEIAQFLVDVQGIDVNLAGSRRATALTWAKKNNDQAMIDLLISRGAH